MRVRITDAVAAWSVVALLAACNSGSSEVRGSRAESTAAPSPVESTPASATTEPAASPTAAAQPAGEMTVAVYYLVDTRRGIRLQREFRQVRRTSTPVRSALETMLHEAPLDRDYNSLWPRTTQVRGISRDGTTTTVDLSRAALDGRAGSEATARSVQQLVYTVTAADTTTKTVRILVEGRPVEDLWGHESLERPVGRASHIDVLAPVSIDSPNEGARVAQTFTLSGTATVFEANVQWKVTRGCAPGEQCPSDRPTLRSGFVTASAGAPARGTWSVRVTLPDEALQSAGYFEITAFEESAEDGSVFMQDTKVVRVG